MKKLCSGCLDMFFIYLGDKKVIAGRVRQVVLYSNNCMGIYNCMDSAFAAL